MKTEIGLVLLITLGVQTACSGDGDGSGGGTGGAPLSGGSPGTGGSSSGGTPSVGGGAASGGASTGGAASGGASTGGDNGSGGSDSTSGGNGSGGSEPILGCPTGETAPAGDCTEWSNENDREVCSYGETQCFCQTGQQGASWRCASCPATVATGDACTVTDMMCGQCICETSWEPGGQRTWAFNCAPGE